MLLSYVFLPPLNTHTHTITHTHPFLPLRFSLSAPTPPAGAARSMPLSLPVMPSVMPAAQLDANSIDYSDWDDDLDIDWSDSDVQFWNPRFALERVADHITCDFLGPLDPVCGADPQIPAAALTVSNDFPAPCAAEGGMCSCNGAVRFGTDDGWTGLREVLGSVHCTSDAFGRDPNSGDTKKCQCLPGVGPLAMTAAERGWGATTCAVEGDGQPCSCAGAVRYGRGALGTHRPATEYDGAATLYSYWSAWRPIGKFPNHTDSITCSNDAFGDVYPGEDKHCECLPGAIGVEDPCHQPYCFGLKESAAPDGCCKVAPLGLHLAAHLVDLVLFNLVCIMLSSS